MNTIMILIKKKTRGKNYKKNQELHVEDSEGEIKKRTRITQITLMWTLSQSQNQIV